MVFKAVQNDTESHIHQQLCARFNKELKFEEMRAEYQALEGDR